MADQQITVSLTNLAPAGGTRLTPLWFGIHNGKFDIYDRGVAATPGLESLAEDGSAVLLGQEFDQSTYGQLDGQVGRAPIAPGATVRANVKVDSDKGNATYFSYASMVLPSNDFFVANGDPRKHRIFDDLGNFIGTEFYILGNEVLDAGTEINDEKAESTAFFSQSEPNTGTPQTGTVAAANGFIENGRILSAQQFANADYTAAGYQVAKVDVDGAEVANTFSTDFSDLAKAQINPNDFQLGKAKFTSETAVFEGVSTLHSSAGNAWVTDAGGSLRVNFDEAVAAVSFRAVGLDGATVKVIGQVDQESNTVDVTGEDIRLTDELSFSGLITALELVNTSTGANPDEKISDAPKIDGNPLASFGAALDDLRYTLVTPEPEPISEVTVTIENLSPANGTTLTPFWVGFHDGEFDTYNRGEAATPGLEKLAEDGKANLLGDEFDQSGHGFLDGVIGTAPIAPGKVMSQVFDLDENTRASTYFSYASMLLPSNDFFVSNGNPQAHKIFDDEGNFIGADFFIVGSDVLDAGTEVNDELAASTAFFSQASPNTGEIEDGVVTAATGFIPNGRILSAEAFAAGDFTAEGYQVARVRVGSKRAEASIRPQENNLVLIEGNGTAIEFDFEQRNTEQVNEIIAIATDNSAGVVDGIAPGEAGYLDAVLKAGKTVFSALQGKEFEGFNPKRTLGIESGQFVQFAVIQGGSLDSLRAGGAGQLLLATAAGNADGASALNVNDLGNNQLQLNFRVPQGGGSGAFNDLVVNARFVSTGIPIGAALQNSSGLEVIDLRSQADTVNASFELRRQADFDNQVGFYRIENEQGQVQSGLGLLSPGDEGYQEAAIRNRVGNVLLGGIMNNDILNTSAQLSPGQLLAPFIIAEGVIGELLDTDFENDPDIFFAYRSANSDNANHVLLLGDNTFGFEDVEGGGDADFDDLVVRATFS